MITTKQAVIGGGGSPPWYWNTGKEVLKSSLSDDKYTASWYRRPGNKEDPWISLTDHGDATKNGGILYGGSGTHLYAKDVLPVHNGANVYIRAGGRLNLRNLSTEYISHVPKNPEYKPPAYEPP